MHNIKIYSSKIQTKMLFMCCHRYTFDYSMFNKNIYYETKSNN